MHPHSRELPDRFDRIHHDGDWDVESDDAEGNEEPQQEWDDPSAVSSVEDKTSYPPPGTSSN